MTFTGPPLPWFIPKAALCLKEHSVYIAKSNFKTIYVLSLYICRLIKGKLGLWQYFLNFPFLLPPIAPSLQLLPRTWSSKPPEQSHGLSSQRASVSTSFFSILQHKALVVMWQVWGPWWVGWERLHHVRLECPSVSVGWALGLHYITSTLLYHHHFPPRQCNGLIKEMFSPQQAPEGCLPCVFACLSSPPNVSFFHGECVSLVGASRCLDEFTYSDFVTNFSIGTSNCMCQGLAVDPLTLSDPCLWWEELKGS